MKKSLNINLAGLVFHIDEDAYHLLSNYLDSLQRHYKQTEEGEEILTDIEARIAEIFQDNLTQYHTVVTIAEVENAIELIGRPEDFTEADNGEPHAESYSEPFYNEPNERAKNRKLYRDPDGRYVAGVAAGLGHFLGVAPVYVRAGFIILQFFYGLGIFLYIALWVLIKEAKTSAQKLEMRGEQVNLSNIEKTIRDEFENVKENVKKGFEKSFSNVHFEQYARQTGSGVRKVMEGFWIFFKALLRLVAIVLGIAFAIGGTVTFAIVVTMLVFPNLPFASGIEGGAMVQTLIGLILPAENVKLTTLALLMVIGIPIIWIVYSGIKLIFNLKTKSKPVMVTSAVLWFIGLGILVSIGGRTAQNFSNQTHIDEVAVLDKLEPDTIRIRLKELDRSSDIQFNSLNIGNLRVIEEDGKIFGIPKFDIKQSHDGQMKLELERSSHGFNKKNASENASKIDYEWKTKNDGLLFNHYFKLNGAERWLDQELRLVLKLPVGKVVYLDESMVKIIYDIKNQQNMWDGHMGDKYWVMTENGLSVLNPEKYRDQEIEWQKTVQEEVIHELKQVEEELKHVEHEISKEIRTEIEKEIEEIKIEAREASKEAIKAKEEMLREMEEELQKAKEEKKKK